MLRTRSLLVAVALAAGAVGCTQCDTCDDFPTPCVGAMCNGGGPVPVYTAAPLYTTPLVPTTDTMRWARARRR